MGTGASSFMGHGSRADYSAARCVDGNVHSACRSGRDHGSPWEHSPAVEAAWAQIYRDPKEFWDLYPADRVELAKHRTAPPTAPKVAWVDGGYCDHKAGDLGSNYSAIWTQSQAEMNIMIVFLAL